MNADIRDAVKVELQRRGLTHAQIAEQLGMPRPQVTRMLTGRSGNIPKGWQKLLIALDLQLSVIRKGE